MTSSISGGCLLRRCSFLAAIVFILSSEASGQTFVSETTPRNPSKAYLEWNDGFVDIVALDGKGTTEMQGANNNPLRGFSSHSYYLEIEPGIYTLDVLPGNSLKATIEPGRRVNWYGRLTFKAVAGRKYYVSHQSGGSSYWPGVCELLCSNAMVRSEVNKKGK